MNKYGIKYYYSLMQPIFLKLYNNSCQNINFNKLMKLIVNPNNILLAYYRIKRKKDLLLNYQQLINGFNIRINNIKQLTQKAVSIKYIKQYSGKLQMISKHLFWNRLIQQAIKQILEPICEAKFNANSYGFRKGRSHENALASISSMINVIHNYYAVDIQINDFYCNVNHQKLMRQLWAFGIHDKKLLFIINCILKTPLNNNKSKCGIVQTGLLMSIFTNIVLTELDNRLSHMWCEHPVVYTCGKTVDRGSKGIDKGHAYELMRKTNLREVRFIRYAHEIKIITSNYNNAKSIAIGIIQWLHFRLKLFATFKIIKLTQKNLIFNGFNIKAVIAGNKMLKHKIIPKLIARVRLTTIVKYKIIEQLRKQLIRIQRAKHGSQWKEVNLYNEYVLKIHNYYKYATNISQDIHKISWIVNIIMYNRFGCKHNRIISNVRKAYSKITDNMVMCRPLFPIENKLYSGSKQLVCFKPTKQPLYPIGYVQFKIPLHCKRQLTYNLDIQLANLDTTQYQYLLNCIQYQDLYNKSNEYANNRMFIFVKQKGMCTILNTLFESVDDIQCHHKIPKSLGGTDNCDNLIIIHKDVHKLIHAINIDIINEYLYKLHLNNLQLIKINKLRKLLKLPIIQN